MIRASFEREAEALWASLRRAAGTNERLGALWSRDGDPRVTRLVQAAAYAFGRVREKIEDDLPEISHPVVAAALPEILRATPSMTVAQFRDDARVQRRITEHPSRPLASRAVGNQACRFVTCWPVVTAPLTLALAEIRAREAGSQTLILRLEAYDGHPLIGAVHDRLRCFVDAAEPIRALDVVHAVTSDTRPVHARLLDARGHEVACRELPLVRRRWTALEPDALPLVPGSRDRSESGTALRAFFAFPEVFGFFDLEGLHAAVREAPEIARSMEISIPLGTTVDEDARDATFRLGCSPAANVFESPGHPLRVQGLGPCGTLVTEDGEGREILDVLDVVVRPDGAPDAAIPVRLWETHLGAAYLDEEMYLRVDRRAAVGHGPTELRAALLRPDGGALDVHGMLVTRLLATDGARTSGLLKGDLRERSQLLQLENVTRVTRAYSAAFDEKLPWRANAYARMPLSRFAQAASLAGYLDLHDVSGARRAHGSAADAAAAGIHRAALSPARRVRGDEVVLGDQVDIALDEGVFGGHGATWLVGELLARALAERADFLRYARTRLIGADGELRHDYGVRQGHRLPPPFG